MRVLLTGATGLIGMRLCARLSSLGHDLTVLSRDPGRARSQIPYPCEAYPWQPRRELPPTRALENIDAVIHLAGEPIGVKRWSSREKEEIFESRVTGTHHLMEGLKQSSRVPSVVMTASAVGYYGNRGNEVLTEESSPGGDFLSELCVAWEKEAAALRDRTRALSMRNGIVMAPEGGFLGRMIQPYRYGTGLSLGSGKQWISWIHIEDLVSAYIEGIQNPAFEGAINVTSPIPVTHQEFSRTLSETLYKKGRMPLVGKVLYGIAGRMPLKPKVPAIALRIVLGEMSGAILGGQRVLPRRLEQAGFIFRFPALGDVLNDVLSV